MYQDQPGALNESIADVFASCFVQWMDNTSPKDSSWMIGDHCMKDFGNVSYSLRSMSSPGEGFINHPILGSDPQRGHMDAYYSGKDDNGGVHINSGIPNRAFYLLCTRLEENMNFDKSWDIPLAIWYSALERCNPNCDFSRFAALTVESVNDHILSDTQVASAKEILKSCWEDVGVKLSNLE